MTQTFYNSVPINRLTCFIVNSLLEALFPYRYALARTSSQPIYKSRSNENSGSNLNRHKKI
jgi:hypothetical protein